MKKRLLPCLAVLFLLLTACGVGHMGVHALEDITDADIVANEMGYSAVLWQSYSDTFSCEASWESFRGVEYLWTLPGNEARTVHVTYAEQECGDYRVVLVLPDDTVVELEEGEHGGGAGGEHLDGRGRRRGRWGLHRPMGIINDPKKAARRIIAAYSIKMLVRDKTSG